MTDDPTLADRLEAEIGAPRSGTLIDQLLREAVEALRAIAAIHTSDGDDAGCAECMADWDPWPCATARALGGTDNEAVEALRAVEPMHVCDCGFTYSADHDDTDNPGHYTCPVCWEAKVTSLLADADLPCQKWAGYDTVQNHMYDVPFPPRCGTCANCRLNELRGLSDD